MKKKAKQKAAVVRRIGGRWLLLLLQIYSLNIEFYQLQATHTKTGRPAQWALATWAPEGPVSSA